MKPDIRQVNYERVKRIIVGLKYTIDLVVKSEQRAYDQLIPVKEECAKLMKENRELKAQFDASEKELNRYRKAINLAVNKLDEDGEENEYA